MYVWGWGDRFKYFVKKIAMIIIKKMYIMLKNGGSDVSPTF